MIFQQIRLETAAGADLRLVNQAYDLWWSTHSKIAGEAEVQLQPESFHRSHVINLIHRDGEVLSMSLSSFLNLDLNGMEQIRYFSPMSLPLRDQLKSERLRVMSVEWITVHPKERERIGKIRQPDLILGCAVKGFINSDADIAMGFSRIDVGADRIAENFGFKPLEPTAMLGIDCNVMVARQSDIKPHKFAVIQRAIDELYNSPTEKQKAA